MILPRMINESKSFVNQYYTYDLVYANDEISQIDKRYLIAPQSLIHVKNGQYFGPVKCLGVEEDYLILQKTDGIIVLAKKEGILREMPFPRFEIGNIVRETLKPEIEGVVFNIIWHQKDNEYKYIIKVNDKEKSRRYSESELQLQ
jgi:hypothetical protein